jgi:hypothetical protein
MSKDSHWAILNSIPSGFRTAPVLAALNKFKAPACGAKQYETEIHGLVCQFDRPYDDGELALNQVFCNGQEIELDWLAEDFQQRLLERAYIDQQADRQYNADCEAEARFEARMEAREAA